MITMKVLVDMTHITPEKLYASLSIYTLRILDNIPKEERNNFILLIPIELETFIKKKYHDYTYIKFSASRNNVSNNRVIRIVQQIRAYKKCINSSMCNILFITNDLYPYTFIKTKLKKVVVIHDLKVIKDTPQSIGGIIIKKINILFYKYFMKYADKVVAISNYTKQDISKLYPTINPNKIKVIYNCICLASSSIPPSQITSLHSYILYVNTLQPHKNLMTLLRAFNKIKEHINSSLVIVGKETIYWHETILPFIKKNHLNSRIIHLQNISNEELKYLYENAQLFITPSLREGFGYTPIEAAICKCPVICSMCEALPDTTQNLVNYYTPPLDGVALSQAILQILKTPPSYNKLAEISTILRQKYSPTKQIKSFLSLFYNC